MKVTLRELVESEGALANVAQMDVGARLAFSLALVLNAVKPHLDAKRAAHQSLLKQYGAEDEKRAGFYTVKPENIEAFSAEYEQLLDTECELAGIGKLRAEHFEREGLKFSAADLARLGWLIVFDGGLFEG